VWYCIGMDMILRAPVISSTPPLVRTTADREYYDQAVAIEDIPPFVDLIALYLDNWAKDRRRWFGSRTDVRVLELGAGSCAASYLLSREPWVSEIVAGDISSARADQFRPYVLDLTGGDHSKLRFAEVDMNEPLPFPDGYFDLVVMDSALHHSRAIWSTLSEIHRVLKPKGHFVAQREHYLAPLSSRWKMRRMLVSDEVRNGVSENAYLKEQYDYYLKAHGFRTKFRAIFPTWLFKSLFFLNGLAFSKYNLIAYRANSVARPL
jgi:ubiquinone/menaquinone biosynthesis C-methylase UbiE